MDDGLVDGTPNTGLAPNDRAVASLVPPNAGWAPRVAPNAGGNDAAPQKDCEWPAVFEPNTKVDVGAPMPPVERELFEPGSIVESEEGEFIVIGDSFLVGASFSGDRKFSCELAGVPNV